MRAAAAGLTLILAAAAGGALWLASDPGPPREVDPLPAPAAPAATPSPVAVAAAAPAGSVSPSTAPAEPEPTVGEPTGAPAPPRTVVLQGRVVDQHGSPVANATVRVFTTPQGSGGRVALRTGRGRASWRGATSRRTDEAGRFRMTVSAGGPLLVALAWSSRFTPHPEGGAPRWVEPPAEIELVVHRSATATLIVRLQEASGGQRLANFAVQATHGSDSQHERARGEAVEIQLDVPEAEGIDVLLALREPRPPTPLELELHLAPGERREVLLSVDATLSGWVVDASGAPIAAAFVFFGRESDARAEGLFAPYRLEEVCGVRSGDDGSFRLPGSGPWITAWHPRHCTATVRREEAGHIVLQPRGAIRGVVLDGAEAPRRDELVWLDQSREARTDALGRFVFDAVEPGVRVLEVDARAWAVNVTPGRTEEVRIVPGLERVELVLEQDGRAVDHGGGLLIGQSNVARAYGLGAGNPIVMHDLRPGPYLLLTAGGAVARLTVAGERVKVTLGRADLTLHTRPGRRLQLVPADATAFTRPTAARVARAAGADGTLRFGPLHPGAYVLLGESGEVVAEARVAGPGSELDLR